MIMKAKDIVIKILSILPLLVSCNKDINSGIKEAPVIPTDELSIVCKSITNYKVLLQSDPEVVLCQHIIFNEGCYFLNMSEDDASQLGIEKNIYKKYVEFVKELNL